MYSYNDCVEKALFFDPSSFHCEEKRKDIIAICDSSIEEFWANLFEKKIKKSNFLKICQNLEKYLKKNWPLPHITKKCFFYGYPIYVERGIFIPQKDTELLVDKILEISEIIWKKKKNLKVLEIGFGSGCSVVALAKNRPDWIITAIDKNEKALKNIEKNLEINGVDKKKIKVLLGDIFPEKKEKFDIIFFNPPYLSDKEYDLLNKRVKKQPKMALVAKKEGYFFYIEILKKINLFLKKRFLIIFEIGFRQHEKILDILSNTFPSKKVSSFVDLEGHWRVVSVYNF